MGFSLSVGDCLENWCKVNFTVYFQACFLEAFNCHSLKKSNLSFDRTVGEKESKVL